MLQIAFEHEPTEILCLGAHSDDIEIGCGGTILRLVGSFPGLKIAWAVLSAEGQRAEEARASSARFLDGVARADVRVEHFRDGFFPYEGGAIKEWFEEMKHGVSPDLILTHSGRDSHQDHRLVSQLTWNTFRDHTILEYEIPKYDGDFSSPNAYIPLDKETCLRKSGIILECFSSQNSRHWFDEETFMAVMRLRGVESRSTTGYAEGFFAKKLVLGL